MERAAKQVPAASPAIRVYTRPAVTLMLTGVVPSVMVVTGS
jgi:hypothetical protein